MENKSIDVSFENISNEVFKYVERRINNNQIALQNGVSLSEFEKIIYKFVETELTECIDEYIPDIEKDISEMLKVEIDMIL